MGMGSSLYFLVLTHLLLMLSCFHILVANSLDDINKQPRCHDHERKALLQFNQSILIDDSAASPLSSPSAYPKTATWKLQQESGGDCCSWDGVECDDNTGYVIGLDLSNSFLYGSINSTSSLFRLVHLQKLNLARNNFNHSQIPPEIVHLSSLTYLNLSRSSFSGQIPIEISTLTKLNTLDLTLNLDYSSNEKLLSIEKPSLDNLIQNLTDLQYLGLSQVNISAALPDTLSNLSSLTTLHLRDCELKGEFPAGVFRLPYLQRLSVKHNPYLNGYLPEFNISSPLNFLRVATTNFSGKLPDSISKLKFLATLDVGECNFSGLIPPSLGNLTNLIALDLSHNNFYGLIPSSLGNLTNLMALDLSYNNFYGLIPSSLGNLADLMALDLSHNNFSMSNGGETLTWLGNQAKLSSLSLEGIKLNSSIPSFLANMTALTSLKLGWTQITGTIPSWLGNLTQLTELRLEYNQLYGPIPKSFSGLVNLEQIYVEFNSLNGTVELDMFLQMKHIFNLQLSWNLLVVLPQQTSANNATSIPKFVTLGLGGCNLDRFPDFLRYQDKIQWLDLGSNKINGKIPKWMHNVGNETLFFISFCNNYLIGFEEHPIVLPWNNARILSIAINQLQGSVPVPPPLAYSYTASGNSFTGEISPLFCNLNLLYGLDLSYNKLSGMIPRCLDQLSDSLSILNLQYNNLQGTIPEMCMKSGSKLNIIQLSSNRLQAPLPKSLANCSMLEFMNLGYNQINDRFPMWLGTLPELSVLLLRSSGFHGAIGSPETNSQFPKLRIIDLSHNNFTGKLPSKYFKIWNAMKTTYAQGLSYFEMDIILQIPGFSYSYVDLYSNMMVIQTKGTQRQYKKIPMFLTVVDLSSNRFEGDIPESIANLIGLKSLNLSNNNLVGRIPSSLGNLTTLESLDLSQNNLSGEIPPQLADLTFLSALDLSHNHLTGSIPGGGRGQFGTFPNTSFGENPGLCGQPLLKKCGDQPPPPPSPSEEEEEEDSGFPSGYDWIFLSAGFGSGLVVGLLVGHTITTNKHIHGWFVKTFGRKARRRRN